MKNKIIYLWVLALAMALVACEENEIMPSFNKLGTATHTMADIVVSKSAPLPSESISLQISYVNPSSDPLIEVMVKAKVGTADYVEIQKFNVASEARDQIITKTIAYVAPATAATTVVFDMVITSQKEYPQIQRASIKTK